MVRILLGTFVIVLGLFAIIHSLKNAIKCTGKAVGTVSGTRAETHRNGNSQWITYTPVIEFTADSRTINKPADIGSSDPDAYPIGSTLDIFYDPKNPEVFIIKGKSVKRDLVGGIIALILGILFVYATIKLKRY